MHIDNLHEISNLTYWKKYLKTSSEIFTWNALIKNGKKFGNILVQKHFEFLTMRHQHRS